MSENETTSHQLPLGKDGEGNLLTGERRVELAAEINNILAELRELRAELAEVVEEIATESSIQFSKRDSDDHDHTIRTPVSELIEHARTLRTDIAARMESIGVKSSSYYPPMSPADTDA